MGEAIEDPELHADSGWYSPTASGSITCAARIGSGTAAVAQRKAHLAPPHPSACAPGN
jgi:hypothetical protein